MLYTVHYTVYGLLILVMSGRANKILSPKFKIPTHIRSSSHNHIIFHAYSVMLAIFVWGAISQHKMKWGILIMVFQFNPFAQEPPLTSCCVIGTLRCARVINLMTNCDECRHYYFHRQIDFAC